MLMKLVSLFQKRPSDKTIRIGRIIFGSIFLFSMYYNLIYLGKDIDNTFLDFSIFGFVLSSGYKLEGSDLLIVKYVLTGMGIIPIFMGIIDICLFKKKYMRIIQIIFGIVLFYISAIIIPNPNLFFDFDVLIGLLGLFPLVAGITGKCITKKCLKFGEKINKIRV